MTATAFPNLVFYIYFNLIFIYFSFFVNIKKMIKLNIKSDKIRN